VYKQPITDSSKNSKKGKLALVPAGDGTDFRTMSYMGSDFPMDQLETVFLNGEVKRTQKLEEIRELAQV